MSDAAYAETVRMHFSRGVGPALINTSGGAISKYWAHAAVAFSVSSSIQLYVAHSALQLGGLHNIAANAVLIRSAYVAAMRWLVSKVKTLAVILQDGTTF